MKRIISVVLASAFALVLGAALVGCGGGSSEDYTANFAGDWKLYEMEDESGVTSHDDIAMLDSLGMAAILTLGEDGAANLDLMGEIMSGTWEANSATECTVTLDGEAIDGTLADDMLVLESGGASMTFEKASAEAEAAE